MRMKLEQQLYEIPRTFKQGQSIFVVGDLENLSASALYDTEKARFIRGGIENIRVYEDGDAFKVYSDLLNNSLKIGFQPSDQKHEEYMEIGMFDAGPLVSGGS